MFYQDITELIGSTPLLKLNNYAKKYSLKANIYAKLEAFNPAGSAKDRIAAAIIADAEAKGRLQQGGLIIEPTSGNTGIGLCAVAASKGYRCIIVMPESMSIERRLLMKAYGAELVLTPAAEGMKGAIAKAEELAAQHEGSIIAGQFVNPANPAAHYATTGPELWADLGESIDIFVAGIGTGGTISGVGRFLKEQKPGIEIVGIEPAKSPLISEGRAGSHPLQGIGANFVPQTLDMSVVDRIVTVEGEDAFQAGRELASCEGFLAGISSGAALFAARRLAEQPENFGKNIVALLPDTGERYLSSAMFQE